jgi:hypothetical protein
MRIYILSSGKYGSRVTNNLAEHGMASNIVGIEEFPEDLPLFIDEFQEYIPHNLPLADLILAVGLSGDINMIVPEVAQDRFQICDNTHLRAETDATRPATGNH